MKIHRIAAIPGDGIGQGVVPAGCLGIAQTANLNHERRHHGMWEPIHGCALPPRADLVRAH
jgi:isocitrate/isopropylmalate dehydrogenase